MAFLAPTSWAGLGAAGAGASAAGGSTLLTALGGPVGIALGAGQALLGIAGASLENKAKQQDYLNQTAFQNATTAFNTWQAGLNADIQDLNSDYQYWAETVQYNNNLAQVAANRNYEFSRELVQAETVARTRASATAAGMIDADAIAGQLRERAMQESMAIMQQKRRALQANATVQAMSKTGAGRTLESFERNFAFQLGEYTTISSINEGIRNRQYRRDQYANIARSLSQYNSQQFYERQKYIDPIAPFAPLPTLVMPPPPSMTGAKPIDTTLLGAGTAVLGGVNTALGIGDYLSSQ
tara:strand:- start:2605 stop:3495 length:891 start_codon:yes stop_codon:yes gene_type:complete